MAFLRSNVRSLATDLGLVCGTFDTNSTSTPDGVTGDIESVARTGAGCYTVTWKHAWPQREYQTAELEEDDGALKVKCVGGDVTARTTLVKVWTDSVDAADSAAASVAGLSVTSHTVTLTGLPGYIVSVEATTADAAGAKKLMHTGTVAQGECKVVYTAGVATLSFHATDNVTAISYTRIPVEGALAAAAAADSTDKTIRVFAVVRNTANTRR